MVQSIASEVIKNGSAAHIQVMLLHKLHDTLKNGAVKDTIGQIINSQENGTIMIINNLKLKTATDRFTLYQGRQRASDQMANMLTDGTAKYNRKKRSRAKKRKKRKKTRKSKGKKAERQPSKSKKWKPARFSEAPAKVPLIVFGAGMFGKDAVKLKGHRCGVVGKLFATLKKREAEGRLIVVTIDEFKTSKTCSLCFNDDMQIVDTPGFKGFGVLHCKQCRKLWQRDVNAANNMSIISEAVWSGEGRPEVFKPKKKTVSP